MAKANTYEMEKSGSMFRKEKCALCDNKPEYRAFYYPTFMNGDAECLGDYCEEHKNVDLKKVYNGQVKLINYKIK